MWKETEFRQLLIADLALIRGVADAEDVAAALQRYWKRRRHPEFTIGREIARIAGILPEAIEPIEAEVDKLVEAAGGSAADVIRSRLSVAQAIEDRAASFKAERKQADGKATPRLRPLHEDRYDGFLPAGEGGMGIVYWALDTDLNREVAFKVVRPELGATGPGDTPQKPTALRPPAADTPASEAFEELKSRFMQEVWVTGGMEHPGIVPVYEVGETPAGVPYYTMRFVRGNRTLATELQRLSDAPLDDRLQLLDPFLRVCDTLRYAHSRSVVHRDLKPDNVALGGFGEVVILDWGLAKLKGEPDATGSVWQARIQEYVQSKDFEALTTVVGTPGYMAPEAARGVIDAVDEQSDVYSLGAILYQILTGDLPHTFEDFASYRTQVTAEDVSDPRERSPEVPAPLADICQRALARSKSDRTPSVEALADAIRAWQTDDARERKVRELVTTAEVALAGARDLSGAALLRETERANVAVVKMLDVDPEDPRATELKRQVLRLREQGMAQRERQARVRALRIAAVAALVVGLGASVLVAAEFNRQKKVSDRLHKEAATTRDQLQTKTEELRTKTKQLERNTVQLTKKKGELETQKGRLVEQTELLRTQKLALEAAKTLADDKAQAARDARQRAVENLASVYANLSTALLRDGRTAAAQLVAAKSLDTHETPDGWAALSRASMTAVPSFESMGARLPITALALSPDGSTLAAGTSHGRILVWETGTGRLQRRWPRQDGPISTLLLSPDGELVYAAIEDKVRAWGVQDGRLARTLRIPKHIAFEDCTTCNKMVLSPNGDQLYAAGSCGGDQVDHDAIIFVWDPKGAEPKTLQGHVGQVNSLTLSADGARLVSGGPLAPRTQRPGVRTRPDFGLQVWDVTGAESPVRLLGGRPYACALSSDGQYAYAIDVVGDGSKRLWNLRKWDLRSKSIVKSREIEVRFDQLEVRGDRIYGGGAQGGIRVWGAKDLEEIEVFAGQAPFVLDRAGRVLYCTHSTDSLRRITLDRGVIQRVRGGHQVGIRRLRIDRAGQRLLSVGNSVVLWDLATGRMEQPLPLPYPRDPWETDFAHRYGWDDVAVSADLSRVFQATSEGKIESLDVRTRQRTLLFAPPSESPWGYVKALAIAPDGRRLYSAWMDGMVRALDVATGRQVGEDLAGGPTNIRDMAVSPDGRRLFVAGGPVIASEYERASLVRSGAPADNPKACAIRVFDLENLPMHRFLIGHESAVTALAPSPDGRYLFSGSTDGIIHMWDVSQWKYVASLRRGSNKVAALQYARGRRLYAAYEPRIQDATGRGNIHEQYLVEWDLRTRQIRRVLEGHDGAVSALALAPDGTLYTGGHDDNDILKWNLGEPSHVRLFEGNKGAILDMVLTSDGRHLFTTSADWFGGGDAKTRMWDCMRGSVDRALPVKEASLTCSTGVRRLVHSEKHKRLFSSSWDPCGSGGFSKDLDIPAIQVVEFKANDAATALRGSSDSLLSLALAPDGRLLYAGSARWPGRIQDRRQLSIVRLFDLATGIEKERPYYPHPNSVTALSLSSDGLLLAVGGTGGAIRVWNLRQRNERSIIARAHGNNGVGALHFLPGQARFFSGAGPRELQQLQTGRRDARIQLWDVDLNEIQRYEGHQGFVEDLATSPDGKWLYSASRDGSIRIWNVENGRQKAMLDARVGEVRALALSPDGALLYTGGNDPRVFCWELDWFMKSAPERVAEIRDRSGLEIEEFGVVPVPKRNFEPVK